MRAVQFDKYGPADVLHIAEIELPALRPNMVRVKIAAAGVNPADFKWRSGLLKEMVPLQLPHIIGYDIAGTVEAVSNDVSTLAVGERVFAMLDTIQKGGYAEFAVAPAEYMVRMPEGLDYATAAALPTAGLTGFQMIDEQIKPAAGERVLITGAVGAVGRFATFAARRRGAHVIAAVRASQRDEALALGASETIVLGEEEWRGAPFDHVADTIGGPAVAALCRKLAPGGFIRTVSTTPIIPDGLPATPIFFPVHQDSKQLEAIGDLIMKREITMPIARRFPLERAAEAHRLVEAGGLRGKVVLEP